MDVSNEPFIELFETAKLMYSGAIQLACPLWEHLRLTQDLCYITIHHVYAFRHLDESGENDFDIQSLGCVRSAFENTLNMMWIYKDLDPFNWESRARGFFWKSWTGRNESIGLSTYSH